MFKSPTSIILEAGVACQQKTILFRNPTDQDIILKLDSNAPELALSRKVLVVPAKRTATVDVAFVVRERPGLPPILLHVYARPIYKETIPELKNWTTSADVCEKSSRLAYLLEVVVSNVLYSAPQIILDLPGNAAMIEPRNIINREDYDVATAKPITNKDLDYQVRTKKTEPEEYCDLMRSLLDTIYPPV